MSLGEMLDKRILQEIQDQFSRVTGMFVCCMDEDRKRISEISGQERLLNKAVPYFDAPFATRLLEQVNRDTLEDQIIESLPDGAGRMAAVAVKNVMDTCVFWLVLELNECRIRGSEYFEASLDLLHLFGNAVLKNKAEALNARVENIRSETIRMSMEQAMTATNATTAVVQLLDDDSPVEEVMEKWLGIVCPFLQMDSAQLFQLKDDGASMDLITEWYRAGIESFFQKKKDIPSYTFLYTDKPVILSGEALKEIYSSFNDKIEVKAVMIFPILRQNNSGIVLSLNHRSPHEFTMQEIKFVADAIKVLHSIILRRIQKNSMASSYASLEAILDHIGSAVCVVDEKEGAILFANEKLKNQFASELQDRSFMDYLLQGVKKANGNTSTELYHEPSGCWFDFSYREIAWVDGRPVTMYTLYDITDKKLYQKKIEQQANTDFLTGLYNRMCCEKDLKHYVREAEKVGGTGAVLYLDLDDFKHINDSLGHQYGDVLLKAISHAFQRINGVGETCYRMGGDEFVMIVSPYVYSELDRILGEVKEIFSKPWFLKNSDYYCTMSMGIVKFPENGVTVLDLIKKADIAMYEAKKKGKNNIIRYNDNIGAASDRRLDMEKNMRDATIDGYREFVIYYQPIINVHNEEIECAGAEALIRWNSAHMGFISPAEFIPLAEYLGLINPIGNYVLQEACRHCRQWNDNGYPDYKVNVNLSVVQLLQPDIVDIIEKTIKGSGMNPKNLTLEVTESLAINDMERMKEILNGIKALGVKLALDDFGTGYSSLNHIREIPFDIIKVDQSFVKNLASDDYAKSFVKMVSELAEAIGVSVCVEGIETLNQYAVLHGMKVKYIQGYFFDRPMTRAEFEAKYVQQ